MQRRLLWCMKPPDAHFFFFFVAFFFVAFFFFAFFFAIFTPPYGYKMFLMSESSIGPAPI
jgi:hypothetical protein